ncbi:hypothetical protein AAG906_008034 [Vitis piasezkii]
MKNRNGVEGCHKQSLGRRISGKTPFEVEIGKKRRPENDDFSEKMWGSGDERRPVREPRKDLLCLDLGVQRLDIAEVAFKPRKVVLRVCIVKRLEGGLISFMVRKERQGVQMLFTPLGGTTSPHQVQLQLYVAAITVAVPIVVPIIITIAITNIAAKQGFS